MPCTLCCLNFLHFSMHHSHSTGYKHLKPVCDLWCSFMCETIIIAAGNHTCSCKDGYVGDGKKAKHGCTAKQLPIMKLYLCKSSKRTTLHFLNFFFFNFYSVLWCYYCSHPHLCTTSVSHICNILNLYALITLQKQLKINIP